MKRILFVAALLCLTASCNEKPADTDPGGIECQFPVEPDYWLLNESYCTISIVNNPRCCEFPDSLVLPCYGSGFRFRSGEGDRNLRTFLYQSNTENCYVYYLNGYEGDYRLSFDELPHGRCFFSSKCYKFDPKLYNGENYFMFFDSDYDYAVKHGMRLEKDK